MLFLSLLFFFLSFSFVKSEVYFRETFDDDGWKDRWVVSQWKPKEEVGTWKHTPGDWFVDPNDRAIKTSTDARFYTISAPLLKPFKNIHRDLIVQFVVKHEQTLDCGGGYVKLLRSGPKGGSKEKKKEEKKGKEEGKEKKEKEEKEKKEEKKEEKEEEKEEENPPTAFGGDTPYAVMFGPDRCGSDRKTHVILHFARPNEQEGKNMDHLSKIDPIDDSDAHLYALHLLRNDTYVVQIDGQTVASGLLAEHWPFQPPRDIDDERQTKPQDWIDEKEIPDPNDVKPKGYDDIPAQIPDPSASKPTDWDEEEDGTYEAPLVENPAYKGEWKPKMVPNPLYKGEWKQPKVKNPAYFTSETFHAVCDSCTRIGIDIWQVKAGTVFDDMLVTDDVQEAKKHEGEVLEKVEKLKKKHEAMEKVKKKKEEEEREEKEKEAKEKEKEKEKAKVRAKGRKEEEEEEEDDDDDDEGNDAKEEL